MKDQIENSIKKSLEGFEAPYNPAAWDSMKARLDANRPTTTAKPTGKTGWWIAASVAVIGISVIAYNTFKAEENTTTAQTTPNNLTEEQVQSNEVNSETNIESINVNPTDFDSNESQSKENSNNSTTSSTPSLNTNDIEMLTNDVNGGDQVVNTNSSNHQTNTNTSSNSNSANQQFAFPSIAAVCQNDVITINNPNAERMIVTGPDLHHVIPANESRKIRVKSSGIHKMVAANGNSEAQFIVNEAPQADFNVDPMTKFENGLPTTIVETSSMGVAHEWIIGGNKLTGTRAEGHFYSKGPHDITLVVENSNGCKTSITKEVYIEENYNLMAMNSFRPNSMDPTTSTFMPYALKERDVNFTMIILDPKDGQVVYETNNATEGWDGIDRRTGQLVPMEKVYIWKVTIEKLAPGENQNEYSGQVIPVNSSNH